MASSEGLLSLSECLPTPAAAAQTHNGFLYDVTKSWAENLAAGPPFRGRLPERAAEGRPSDEVDHFLGRFTLRSQIGVPAGPLLDSAYTSLAGSLGYDLVTYKTIRSGPSQGHPPPNIVLVDTPRAIEALALGATGEPLVCQPFGEPDSLLERVGASDISITNSFGMPSMDPAFLMGDIRKAVASLAPGQLLVVSVTASPNPADPSEASFLQDLLAVSHLAVAAGAPVLEVNLSCPNVSTGEGSLYTDPQRSSALIKALVADLAASSASPPPVIVKVGQYPDDDALFSFLRQIASAGAAAVCGINSLSATVVDANKQPALSPSRLTSGVCGAAIRAAALRFVRVAAGCIRSEGLPLDLIGCGGIASVDDIQAMLDAGAKVVVTATGCIWDPYLATRWHRR